MDYLIYKGTSTSLRGEIKEAKAPGVKKVKKRIRKIRWPKNFNLYKPNQQLPDPERWFPKLERAKYAKQAKKAGLQSKTQGTTSNLAQAQTKNSFQQGPSTATQDVAGSKGKTRGGMGGMRKK